MARQKKGAFVGSVVVSILVFFFGFGFIYSAFAMVFSNSISGAFVAAWHNIMPDNVGGFFDSAIPAGFKMHAVWLYYAAFISIVLAGVGALWVLWYGVKTGQFSSGDGRKQEDGLILVEGHNALRKILAGRAKNDADLGVELTKGIKFWIEMEPRHIAFIGGSGSGKTNAMLPLLRSAIRSGSCIIHDSKGDFTANLMYTRPVIFAPWLKDSARWNVAKDITTTPLAAQFAANLVPVPEGGNSIFALAAQSVLTAVIVFLQQTKPKVWTLGDVKDVFEGDPSGDRLEKIIAAHYPRAQKSLGEDKTRASVLMNAVSSLQHVFALADAWKDNDFDVSLRDYLEMADQRPIKPLILQNNLAHQELAAGLFKAVIDFLVGEILGGMEDVDATDRRRLWFFLDETKALPALPSVEKLLNQGRSKGVRVVIGCQNPFQISHWSKSADSDVWGNVGTIFIGNLGEPKGEEWAVKLFGKGPFREWKRSYSGGQRAGKGHATQENVREMDIVPRDELASLEIGTFFVRVKGSKYIPKFSFPKTDKIPAKKLAANPYFLPKSAEEIRLEAEQRISEAASNDHPEARAQGEDKRSPRGLLPSNGLAAAIASAYQRAGDGEEAINA